MDGPAGEEAGRQQLNRRPEEPVPAMEIDVATVVAIWMGGVIVLVPLIGLMARYGIAPVIEAVGRMRSAGSAGAGGWEGDEVDGRFAELEDRVTALSRAVARLEEAESDRHAPLV